MDVEDIQTATEYFGEMKEELKAAEKNRRDPLELLPVFFLVLLVVLRISWTLYKSFGQKTRNPQQRRMYVGSRPRQSLTPQEPTIFVSPSNLPPPPKYECMAPPSYEEVVGIHYPNYQVQPITQPISAALNQGSSNTPPEITTSVVTVNETAPVAVTVTAESRSTSVTVARS